MNKTTKKKNTPKLNKLHKCLTGIKGFDEVTEGGLPKNTTTLISGGAGSGKTLFGIDFLINGAVNFGFRSSYFSNTWDLFPEDH